MKLEKYLRSFDKKIEKLLAVRYAANILHWDSSTGAPKSSLQKRGETLGFLTLLEYDILINKEAQKSLKYLEINLNKFDEIKSTMIKKSIKEYNKTSKIPSEELKEFQILTNKAQQSWESARNKNDFSLFSPDLKKIVSYLKKFSSYRDNTIHPYNILLDDYEEGMTIEKLNIFFDTIKGRIVPLLKKITESKKQINNDFLNNEFCLDKQKELAYDILKIFNFDLSKGVFKESTHPFTMGADIEDVRLTTRYDKFNLFSGLLSVAHECGHALYEQNISKKLKGTTLAAGTSLGIHESQSRIYENNIFKNWNFLQFYYPKIQSSFPNILNNINVKEFYEAINNVEPSFIRVDADELTYSLHIMIRYEIELGLIEGTIEVEDLPTIWNKKMKEYLGIVPNNDSEGLLQDVHWSHGLFGYFPTYALGSAYAAQFSKKMQDEINLDMLLYKGDLITPLKWLNSKIHHHGSLKSPNELSLLSTGELLNPEYFCDYLENKYSSIYGL